MLGASKYTSHFPVIIVSVSSIFVWMIENAKFNEGGYFFFSFTILYHTVERQNAVKIDIPISADGDGDSVDCRPSE